MFKNNSIILPFLPDFESYLEDEGRKKTTTARLNPQNLQKFHLGFNTIVTNYAIFFKICLLIIWTTRTTSLF